MRIAIIGNFDTGSYAETLAYEINKKHTAYIFNTRDLGYEKMRHQISDVIKSMINPTIEKIIVVQSHALFHNDTNIPLYLYKRELGAPTVDNPTKIMCKYILYEQKGKYENILYPAIKPSMFNPNREKDIIISDPPWFPMPREDFIDILERSQYIIITSPYISVRVLEALACKTIPIIYYDTEELRASYLDIGINYQMAHFIQLYKKKDSLQIKEYNIAMANRGYEFCINNLTIKNRTQQILEVMENG